MVGKNDRGHRIFQSAVDRKAPAGDHRVDGRRTFDGNGILALGHGRCPVDRNPIVCRCDRFIGDRKLFDSKSRAASSSISRQRDFQRIDGDILCALAGVFNPSLALPLKGRVGVGFFWTLTNRKDYVH